MSLFYEQGQLHLGKPGRSTSLSQFCEAERLPFYVYDVAGMLEDIEFYKKSFDNKLSIHYAVKANSNSEVLKSFAGVDLGADVVSAGEARLAMQAGISASKIIFSGVGKSAKEIRFAIENELFQINVESVPELARIAEIARGLGKKARAAFRFNPDVNPETHPYITTGFRNNKFGIAREQLWEFLQIVKDNADSLALQGITVHIGSQLLEIDSLCQALQKTKTLFQDLKGQGFDLKTIDIGGGIGVDYQTGEIPKTMIEKYGQFVVKELGDLNAQILAEPGRVLTAVHGALLSEVQYVKDNGFKKFVIVNTGMHHLARPSLYQAFHRILPVKESSGDREIYDVVGPICESSDVLGQNREFAKIHQGDWLAVGEAGAYGHVMANHYNAHEMPEEILLGL